MQARRSEFGPDEAIDGHNPVQPLVSRDGQEVQRRHDRRMRVLKRATIGFHGQYSGYPCVVRDLSETGAKLELGDHVALPRHFTLHVEIDGFKVDCELVWQTPMQAGVRFTGEKQHTALARTQVLQTSEAALSERYRQEEEARKMREAREAAANRDHAPQPNRLGRKPVAFGKRKFEG